MKERGLRLTKLVAAQSRLRHAVGVDAEPERAEPPGAVGSAEPCDWCGRPGTVEQWDSWNGATLDCRDPALCRVCSFWWHMPGEVIDAMQEAGLDDYWEVMEQFEDELRRKWRGKVARGERRPQGLSDSSGMSVMSYYTTLGDEPE